ncbi:3-phosphoshikimate 1-carboxyvinyltransferase [Capnocytophaga sp. oral taxon 338 str. F0234]|nr:3-phosphoshikimate 1-carboxyvinyltransferase [Capnocytophaga sp. oral taxon 338 str. F0234]
MIFKNKIYLYNKVRICTNNIILKKIFKDTFVFLHFLKYKTQYMNLFLKKRHIKNHLTLNIGGSKSETNRLLLLQCILPSLQVENASFSKDSSLMYEGLHSSKEIINIGDAGTVMRFLTAYYAISKRKVILTGSERMQERPIGILVDALRQLGASITYLAREGYPPLRIEGKPLLGGTLTIRADISSQFISALLMIAPTFVKGLSLHLEGEITSFPYLRMTLSLLNELGIEATFEEHTLEVPYTPTISPKTIIVEPDWSSASYFYSLIALSEVGTTLSLLHYKQDSLQGDRILADIYKTFGVKTLFLEDRIQLVKKKTEIPPIFSYNLIDTPDIAQTIAVTCFGLGVECFLSGLKTLNIKETNRLVALKEELTKLSGEVQISDSEIWVAPCTEITPNIAINPHNDHRMAMAFAPLCLKVPITITETKVVEKSYPNFWEDFKYITEDEN